MKKNEQGSWRTTGRCDTCDQPMVKRTPKQKKQPRAKRAFTYEWYWWCSGCRKMYMPQEGIANREIKPVTMRELFGTSMIEFFAPTGDRWVITGMERKQDGSLKLFGERSADSDAYDNLSADAFIARRKESR